MKKNDKITIQKANYSGSMIVVEFVRAATKTKGEAVKLWKGTSGIKVSTLMNGFNTP
jgi:hypothetical protein